METLARARQIEARLSDGRLPKAKSLKMWAGFGNGRPCDGCGDLILGSEVEHEHDLVGGGTLRFHAACSVLWERMTTAPPAA
jgi:hypothetical protein